MKKAKEIFPDDKRTARALAQWAAKTASTNVRKDSTAFFRSLPVEHQILARNAAQDTRVSFNFIIKHINI